MFRKITLSLLLVSGCLWSQAQKFSLSSPSGTIKINIDNFGALVYRVTMDKTIIVSDSPLGFKFKNEPDMGQDLKLIDQQQDEFDESWVPVIKSKHAKIRNHYKSLRLNFIEQSGLRRKLNLEFRAYNDGIAFRYQLSSGFKIGDRTLTKELTGFNFREDHKAWIADYQSYTRPQEKVFDSKSLAALTPSTKAGLPLLIEIDKTHYAAITEAKIDNYPGFYIGVEREATLNRYKLITQLSPLPYEDDNGIKVRFSDQLYTPWRVIMLGSSPGSLIESEIIQNLNDPCVLKDVSWIKPGISAGGHCWTGESKMDMPTIKQYIDLAAVQGWSYMMIDWQWYGPYNTPEADITKAAPQLDMPELLSYAKEKNVKLWLWLHSADVNRNDSYKTAFALYEKWGIAGVKIDFMDRDDQEMVNWYKKIIVTAAEHQLMVDFHAAYKADGIIRTYPNMITLPFTRMLAGQMDYTPGGFANVSKEEFRQGSLPAQVMNTRCAELAKFVVYESPLTVYSDQPDHILNQLGPDFLQIVPTVWDDIHVISGYPGEHIALVKRTGNNYFIGAMNNGGPRSIKIKLDFLPKGVYQLTSWADAKDAGTNPKKLVLSKKIVNSKTVIPVNMVNGGGYVAEIKLVIKN